MRQNQGNYILPRHNDVNLEQLIAWTEAVIEPRQRDDKEREVCVKVKGLGNMKNVSVCC